MFIIRHRNLFFGITGAIVLASLISLAIFGLKPGTDFTGGTLVQRLISRVVPIPTLSQALDSAGFSGYSLREANTNDYIIRAGNLTNDQRGNMPQNRLGERQISGDDRSNERSRSHHRAGVA